MKIENNISGYAAIFYNALMPLNDREDFKMQYGAINKSYMIDSPYWEQAVNIIINHGEILVKGVSKVTEDRFLKEKSTCNAYISMPMQLLLAFVNKQLGIFNMASHWLMRNIEMRGHIQLFGLLRLFYFFKKSSRP
jgi:hypothetical protein